MKKRKILSILVLIGFIILGIILLKGRTDDLVKILEVNLKYLIPISLLIILSSLLRGYKLKIFMNSYDIKLKLKEWWGLQMVTEFWNSITPFKGGLSARLLYLKKKYKFPYTSSLGIIGMSYLIDFSIYGFLGCILSFFLPITIGVKYSLLIFFSLVFLTSIFFLFFLPLPIKINIKILKPIFKTVNEIHKVRTKCTLMFKLGFNCILRLLAYSLRFYFIFRAFDFTISFYACVIISMLLGLSMILSITPMNLGFRESVVIISAKLLGTGTLLSAFAAVFDRAIILIWIFISTPIFSYLLFNEFKTKKIIKSNV